MSILRVQCTDDHFLVFDTEEGKVTPNAYSFIHYWSSQNASLPFTSNTVLMDDTFAFVKIIAVERNETDSRQ